MTPVFAIELFLHGDVRYRRRWCGPASGLFQFVADDVATGEAFHRGGSTVLALIGR
jgi:hypothetical protein